MAENQEDVEFGDDHKPTDEELNQVNLFKDIDPDAATPEQVAQIIKTGKTLLVQKKNWRTKAQTSVIPVQEQPKLNQHNNPKPPDRDDDLTPKVDMLMMAEEKRQFGYSKQLTPEETDHLFAYAKGSGLKPGEALDSPFFKNALIALRQQNRANDSTPSPSNRSPRVEGKSFGEMKRDEKEKNFSKVVAGLQKK